MSNTECDRVKCVHNKMCNYLFELFNAQYTNVIDCNSYEEERPQGAWLILNGDKVCPFCRTGISHNTNASIRFFKFCPYCGADMRVKDELKEAENEN